MKKLLCVLLIMSMILAFGACGMGNGETVTVYVPDATLFYGSDGELMGSINIVLEKGWERKENFSATYEGDVDKLGDTVPTMIYSDKCVTTEILNDSLTEIYYDDSGRVVCQITEYTGENVTVKKMETTFTYDAQGRKLTETTKQYESTESEPAPQTLTFTYTDTETGSQGTCTDNGISYVVEYDKNYRPVCETVLMTDSAQEVVRKEMAYDEHGNQISVVTYSLGQKVVEMKYTFKTAKVSLETAARLPQFKKGN